MTDRPVRARRPSKATTKTAGGRSAPAKRATKAATKKATATKATATKASATKAVTKKARPTKTSATKTSGTKATPTKTSALKGGETAPKPAKTSALKGGETDPRSAKLSPTPREVSVGTDAAFASGGGQPRRRLKNISEVRHFFRTNDVPILFFGATPFNLLGLDRWVRNFTYITYYDAWDGAHPRVFTPSQQALPGIRERRGDQQLAADQRRGARPHRRRHPPWRATQGRDGVLQQRNRGHLQGAGLRPDPARRKPAPAPGFQDRHHPAGQRGRRTKRSERADPRRRLGGPARCAEKAGLGDELVVQTPYGDSGKTTFFISSEADWKKHSADIVGEEIKVMRRINNRPVAVEAVLTRCGTIVGPFMSELIGYKRLTPSRGGWCGNEMFPEVLTGESRRTATQLVRRLGDRLAKEGYRGFFEVDVLVDTDTHEVYLGELNPRISGASSITNVTAGAYADVPLFLFHILEYMNVDFDLDVDEINERWEELASADVWSQMVMKETDDIVQRLTATPRTGQYSLDASGGLVFRRPALDWHQLQNEREAFFLRIYGPGDYRWKGADLGVLVTKGRLQVDNGQGKSSLAIRARHLIDSIRAEYAGTPIAEPAPPRTNVGVKSG